MPATKILVVEDHEPFRRLISSLLQQSHELQVVGEASDGLEAIQKAEELRPDLILVDIGLPKLSGIGAAEQIRRLIPRATLLFLTQETDADVIRETFRIGGRGYVHKMRVQSDLLSAIDAVLRGETFLSSGLEFSESDHTSIGFGRRLDEISANLTRADKLPDLLIEILDAGIDITAADFGNIQILDQTTSELKMMAQRGFDSEFVKFFETIHCGENCACGMAFRNRKRVIVEDVATDPIFGDAEARKVMLRANARACQSTPLCSQTGEPLGILNTHYCRPARPSDRALQLLEVVARQAGDLIKRLSNQR